MNTAQVPVLVGADTVSTWQAVWDPEREPPDAVTAAVRLGYPIAYWVPAVGMLGQWRWPDNSVSNATVMPWQVQREPGGAALWSSDGGLTWAPALATPPEPPTPSMGLGGFVVLAIAALALGLFAGTIREQSRR